MKRSYASAATSKLIGALYDALGSRDAHLGAGKLEPAIDLRYPLDEIVRALRYLDEHRARGTIVVVPERRRSEGESAAAHAHSRALATSYTPTMSTYLGRLIGYGTWANQGLLDFLATQPPEVFDLTSGGVYGTIRDTLEHLLTSEMGYQNRLVGLPRFDASGRPERPSLADLRALADESAARLASLEEALPAPGAMLVTGDGDRAAATILTQLVMHGIEHRAHVGTILGTNGIEPPDLDSWAHGTFVHGDAWPSDWGPEPAERRLPFSR